MIEAITTMALFVFVGLGLSMAPLVLLWLLYAHGLITQEEAERAVRDMANGQVRV